MKHTAIPPASTPKLPSTITSVHNATAALQTYTVAAVQTHASTPTQSDNQTTLNIIFGVFVIVLAFIAILIGWLQLRNFCQQESMSDEETALCRLQYELLEV
jgi:hypothetical protein